MMRWTHGHTAASGFAAALLIAQHSLIVFVFGLILGAVAVIVWRNVHAITRAARQRAGELHTLTFERVAAEAARKRAAAREADAKADTHLRRAAEQAEAERRAYWRGAVDAKP